MFLDTATALSGQHPEQAVLVWQQMYRLTEDQATTLLQGLVDKGLVKLLPATRFSGSSSSGSSSGGGGLGGGGVLQGGRVLQVHAVLSELSREYVMEEERGTRVWGEALGAVTTVSKGGGLGGFRGGVGGLGL